jgi:phosphoserine phosphatase
MKAPSAARELSVRDVEPILAVAAKLAAPFDLNTMLEEVVAAARNVLHAERGTVWLYDRNADELVMRLSTDMRGQRVPAGTGLVGTCARTRTAINVPDCYADPRFDPTMDRRSGHRTRCMLTLPLVGHNDTLVGVMQVLNKAHGVFDAEDERLASVLAAQCAIALQRVRMTEALVESERLREQLEIARVVQASSLPAHMPRIEGYDVHAISRPADATGGDTYDLAAMPGGALVVLGDATGHGIGAALAVAQMQAMLRMAFRLGTPLEQAFVHVNNQLAAAMPPGHFVTAFVGVLDARHHRVRFHSGGQAPILHYRAGSGAFETHMPTSFPLAAMPLESIRAAAELALEPGDILALVSDGVFEYHDAGGTQFGEERTREVIGANAQASMRELSAAILDAVGGFAAGAPQEDDMTVVLVKRNL